MLGVDPEKVDLVEVNLREPTVTPHRWDGARLADIREQLRLSIRGMKAYLADPNANVAVMEDRKSTRLNSSHGYISYAVFCLIKQIEVVIWRESSVSGGSGAVQMFLRWQQRKP